MAAKDCEVGLTMKKLMLNGEWKLDFKDWHIASAAVPGSVYSALLNEGLIPDPYYRDNETEALKLMDEGCEYSLEFNFNSAECGDYVRPKLVFEGIDTLADIYLNGVLLGSVKNMHRTYSYDVDGVLQEGKNELRVSIESPVNYIREENAKVYCGGVSEAMEGFPHLRKAHCMFGWDWGPRLPDMGIFRNVYIALEDVAAIDSVYVRQEHQPENNQVILHFETKIHVNFQNTCNGGEDVLPGFDEYSLTAGEAAEQDYHLIYTVKAPDGSTISTDADSVCISAPQLWWPNGYGEQPLYTVSAELYHDEYDIRNPEGPSTGTTRLDVKAFRIGLRTMTVNTDADEWGNCFAHEVNGVKVFAMGADYIPEDNLLSRVTYERTYRLLKAARDAHHNCVRVWGGGYYPEDFFYDICDELGLMVWQDCMFACASYELTEDFDAEIRAELKDNVQRIRHHASLGIWCGNNEMEAQVLDGSWHPSAKQKADYTKIFDYIIPQVVKAEDPDTFFWPSSPCSGGNFDNPWDENRGDAHYWDVWHGCKPFTDYRKYHYRYLSEFGFQSFPPMKTIESFTEPKDRNPFSRVMEMHQRNMAANGKLVNYLSATYLYPESFDRFVYLTQMLQAEAIRYGVEHFRRHRGRCMGTVVWQLNDIWPVASWAGIDSFGRWKALHYAEKRMFAPVLLSCEEKGEMDQRPFVTMEPREIETSIRLNLSNETMSAVKATVSYRLYDGNGRVKKRGSKKLECPALSTVWCDRVVFDGVDVHRDYVCYYLDGVLQGTAVFCAPKHFEFSSSGLKVVREGDELVVTADCFTKGVGIEAVGNDFVLEDNYFDMEAGTRRLRIVEGNPDVVRIFCINNNEAGEVVTL